MRLDGGIYVVIVGSVCLSGLYFWSALRDEERRLTEYFKGPKEKVRGEPRVPIAGSEASCAIVSTPDSPCAAACSSATYSSLASKQLSSPSIWQSRLEREIEGLYALTPHFDKPRRGESHLPDTNIVLTTSLSTAKTTDSPCPDRPERLMRSAEAVRAPVRLRMQWTPRFGGARGEHAVIAEAYSVMFSPHDHSVAPLQLRSTVPLRVQSTGALAEFELRANESASFVMKGGPRASLSIRISAEGELDKIVIGPRDSIPGSSSSGRDRETEAQSLRHESSAMGSPPEKPAVAWDDQKSARIFRFPRTV
jgi:hypothetical protein